MIENILPPVVAGYDITGRLAASSLFAAEEQCVERAVPKRRREFATGRSCARRALARLGMPATAILQGLNREPVWPTGVVGSITHCDGYCAAAVASTDDVHTMGIDAELNAPLPPDTPELVMRDDEWDLLHQLPAGAVCWDRLLFSAKESVYKAWFPVERCWLGFEEARISVAPQTNTFVARILRRSTNLVFQSPMIGRFIVAGGFILTSLVIH